MVEHIPVLLQETLKILSPQPGESILDVTLGLGGHSSALLKAVQPKGTIVALDADLENIEIARKKLSGTIDAVTIIHANFSELPSVLPPDRRRFDMIFADLGLSSPHIDDPARGFTFRADAPLDMRFNRSKGMTAALLLSSLDPVRLLSIFRNLGELPASRRLTDAIVARRSESPIRTSADLVETAEFVYGYKAPQFLPQIFQAVRMAVNDERESLAKLLSVIPSLLADKGRAAIMSYHSLEDGMVKAVFRSVCSERKDPLTGAVVERARYSPLTKKPIVPTADEMQTNPRSRSAKLRAIVKTTEYTHDRTATC